MGDGPCQEGLDFLQKRYMHKLYWCFCTSEANKLKFDNFGEKKCTTTKSFKEIKAFEKIAVVIALIEVKKVDQRSR